MGLSPAPLHGSGHTIAAIHGWILSQRRRRRGYGMVHAAGPSFQPLKNTGTMDSHPLWVQGAVSVCVRVRARVWMMVPHWQRQRPTGVAAPWPELRRLMPGTDSDPVRSRLQDQPLWCHVFICWRVYGRCIGVCVRASTLHACGCVCLFWMCDHMCLEPL